MLFLSRFIFPRDSTKYRGEMFVPTGKEKNNTEHGADRDPDETGVVVGRLQNGNREVGNINKATM